MNTVTCGSDRCWICRPDGYARYWPANSHAHKVLHRHVMLVNGGVTRDHHMCDCAYYSYSDEQLAQWRGETVSRDREKRLVISHANGCRCQPCVDMWLEKVFNKSERFHEEYSAQKRAWDYLMAHLTPAQQYTLRRFLYLDVEARDGTMWRLDITSHSGNAWRWEGVREYDTYQRFANGAAIPDPDHFGRYKMQRTIGNMWRGYCIVPYAEVPRADHLLMEYLMLKTDPAMFTQIGILTGETDGWETTQYAEGHDPIIVRFVLYNKWMAEDEIQPELRTFFPPDKAMDSQENGTGAEGDERDCLVP